MGYLLNIFVITLLIMGQTSLKAVDVLAREVEQNRLYYSLASSKVPLSLTKDAIPPFVNVFHDSFTLDGIVDAQNSEPFACMIGESVVEIVKIKNGLKYLKLHGEGVLINSGYIHKNVCEHSDIIWTVPKSSPLGNGSILSLHAFKSSRNKDGSQPIDFYVLYSKIRGAKPGLGVIAPK